MSGLSKTLIVVRGFKMNDEMATMEQCIAAFKAIDERKSCVTHTDIAINEEIYSYEEPANCMENCLCSIAKAITMRCVIVGMVSGPMDGIDESGG